MACFVIRRPTNQLPLKKFDNIVPVSLADRFDIDTVDLYICTSSYAYDIAKMLCDER